MKCLICGKEYKILGSHIRRSHKEINLKTYYINYLGNEIKYCPICGKECKFRNLSIGFAKTCCNNGCFLKITSINGKNKPPVSEKTRKKQSDSAKNKPSASKKTCRKRSINRGFKK